MAYEIAGKSKKYTLVICHGQWRVECTKLHPLHKEIPHIDIPKELYEQLLDNLEGWKDAEKGEKRLAKQEGLQEFDEWCDRMWDMEWDAMED
jgi:hypothetical protein